MKACEVTITLYITPEPISIMLMLKVHCDVLSCEPTFCFLINEHFKTKIEDDFQNRSK